LALFRGMQNQQGVLLCLWDLGWTALVSGDYTRSEALSEESLALARLIGEGQDVARALVSLGRAIAEQTGGRLHVAHLSTAAALDLVRRGRAAGIDVTCEVTPHHLVLSDEEIAASAFSTRTKMNPPLRETSDYLKSEVAKWARVVRETGAKVD